MKLATKIRLLDALVLPVALYGSETWPRTQNDNSKIAAFEMKFLWRIFNIKWEEKVFNARIKEKINQRLNKDRPEIIKRIQIRQAVWFGHVIRIEETRLPRIAMCEKIPLKNKPDRPRQKWIDNVLETVNLTKESRELWRCSVHERANVLQCKPQVVRSPAINLRSKPTQRIRL